MMVTTKEPVREGRCVLIRGARMLLPALILERAKNAAGYLSGYMVPTAEDQSVYTLGEGPFLIAESKVVKELGPEEVFMWLRTALMHERVAEELPEVRALVPSDGHLFFLSEAITRARRKEIEDAFIGAYPRSRMHFYVTQRAKDAEVLWAAEEIVAERDPRGWEKLREAA